LGTTAFKSTIGRCGPWKSSPPSSAYFCSCTRRRVRRHRPIRPCQDVRRPFDCRWRKIS
jgi:hypothetical protein